MNKLTNTFHMSFNNHEGVKIGTIYSENGVLKFEGKADESADVFIKEVVSMFDDQMKNLKALEAKVRELRDTKWSDISTNLAVQYHEKMKLENQLTKILEDLK